MKSLLAAIVLFSILLGTIIFNSFYISSFCDKLAENAEKIGSTPERQPIIQELKDTWDKNRLWLDFSIRTGELERMNDLIEGLCASYNAQNEHELQKYCILIADLAEELAQYEKISVRSLC